ncbi:MAG: alanine/glycine:cation symporter family protein [Desulfobacterales bacterium]|nr:alanine/glycine:cation symporter family protein [Desulfobacterales bacterium]
MKKQFTITGALTLLLLMSMPMLAFAEEAGGGVDAFVNKIFHTVLGPFVSLIFFSVSINGVSFPLIVVWLLIAAVVLSIKFEFVQFKMVKHSIDLLRGVYSDPENPGEVSHFQALCTALSGTVGLGNIAGVAVAVSLGGPGATFWMIVVGFFGMACKFTECTLAVKYRNEYPDGTVSGGPMYYLSKGMSEKGKPMLGKVMGVFFAIMCIFGAMGGGNMFQGNQAHQMFSSTFGLFVDSGWLFGIILAILVGAVIIGGIKSIAKVTDKIVPFMAVMYVGTAVIIILVNIAQIPAAIGVVLAGAFAPKAVAGGIIGVLIQGLKRATFSNEAGVGSAAIAHAAVRTKEPLTEGYVAMLGPFIDTVVICTMTAMVIVITGAYNIDGLSGVALTSSAFQSVFPWFSTLLAAAVLLFAFSTMISWSYYGLKCWTYLFGESKGSEISYKVIFCIFVVIGCSASLGPVIDFSDAAIFAMSIANVIGLYMFMGELKVDMKDYEKRLASGEIERYK